MFWTIIFGIVAAALYRFFGLYSPRSSLDHVQDIIRPTTMAVVPKLKFISVPATAKHTATVIFVHGLGDTGHGWRPVADMFRVDPALAHVKWVLPHSPIRAVKANMDIEMPSWFNIYSFGFDTTEDEAGMKESAGLIKELIKYEIETAGLEPSRIVLGGFSQGGAMSLLTGLTGEYKLAGLACLSGWLPLRSQFKEMANPNTKSTPIFWGHGSADPLVKFQYSKGGFEAITKELEMPLAQPGTFGGVSYNVYDGMGHATVPRELEELKTFIKNAIPAESK